MRLFDEFERADSGRSDKIHESEFECRNRSAGFDAAARDLCERWPRAKLRIGVLALGLGLGGVGGVFAQETETLEASTNEGLATDRKGSEQEPQTQGGPERESRAVEVALQRRFDEVRRELLEEREKSIDRWLTAVSVVLTFFGIVIPIVGWRAWGRFRKIEAEARGSAKAAEEHAVEAAQLVQDIIQHKKQSEQALEELRRLNAEVAQEEPEQASRAAEAVRDNPDAPLIDKAIGFAISRQSEGHTREAVDLWRSISKVAEAANDNALQIRAWHSTAFLLMDSHPEEAIAGFDKVIGLDPNRLTAYGNRGIARSKLGDHRPAISDFNKVLYLDPNDAKAYLHRGLAKAKLGDHRAAISDFDKAIDLDPHDKVPYANRGVARVQLGHHQAAVEDFDKVLYLDPDDAKAYANRGLARAQLGDHRAAISDFDRAIDLEPHDVGLYGNRGVARAQLGHHQAAVEDFDKVLDLHPDDAKAYANRGLAKAQLGDPLAAIEDFDKAIDLDPDNATACMNRGMARAQLGDHRAAIEDFDKVLDLHPNDPKPYTIRGLAKAQLGDHLAAISDFDKAIDLDPNDATARINRGRVRAALGLDSDSARGPESAR